MTENLKNFLETISRDEELAKKVRAMADRAEIIALAAERGMTLTEADFDAPEGELSAKELAGVSGGGECVCVVGGGGTAEGDDNACGCVAVGFGTNEVTKDEGYRCFCSLGGWGGIDVAQRD